MTGYLLNLDDDHHGRTPATMRYLYGLNNGQVPWCTVCADWHPAGALHTTSEPILGQLLRVMENLERATAPVTTCDACGCLVRDLEVCPGCEAARLHHPSCPRRVDAGADCLGCDPLTGTLARLREAHTRAADAKAAEFIASHRDDERGSALAGAIATLACFVAVVVMALVLIGGWIDQAGAAEKPRGHGCRNAARCHQVKPPTPAPTPIAPGCVEYGPACVIDLIGGWPTTPPVVIVQTFPPSFELP